MQTMPLNAVAAAVKGNAGAAQAATGASTGDGGATGTAAAGGDSAFGALLAQQVKLDLPAASQGLPLDLLKPDAKKTGDDSSQLAQDASSSEHPFDPNALAGLVAQALSSIHGRPAAAPVSSPREGTALSAKDAAEGSAKEAKDLTLPVAADATGKQSLQRGEKAAGIADTGKMLPADAVKEQVHGHEAKEALPEQFGDKLAAAQQALTQAAPDAPAAVTAAGGDGQAGRIDRQVGAPGWGNELGQKVVWMVGQQKQSAELQLNPPHLGPLEVRLTLNQDQMTATFVSHNAAVRDAIETAMPRLREMLSDNGIALGNVMVGAESFAQQQQQQQQQQAATQQGGRGTGQDFGFSYGGGDPMVAVLPGKTSSQGEGLVNTFV